MIGCRRNVDGDLKNTMKNDKEKQKLQRLIETIVKEELGSLKEGWITDDPFIGMFIQPFTDIFNTAKAELTKVTATVFENAKKLAKQTVYFAVPFIGAAAVKKAEEEAKEAIQNKIASVNEEHREVYERTYEALRNPDVLGFTFLLDPVLPLTENFALGVKLAKDAPVPLLSTLEVLTGGHPKVTELKNQYKQAIAVEPSQLGGRGWGPGGGGGGWGYGLGGGFDGGFGGGDGGGGGEAAMHDGKPVIKEQQQQQLPAKQQQQKARFSRKGGQQNQQRKQDPAKMLAAQVQQLLKDPEIKRRVQSSPIVKDFQEAGVEAVVNSIKPVMAAKSYEDLKKVVPDFDKIEKQIEKQIPDEKATPEQLEEYRQSFVEEFKELYKQMFIERIKKTLSKEAGPAGNKLLNAILQKIKSL